MASEPLRVLGFAYSEISINDWNENFDVGGNDVSQKFKDAIDE